MPCSSLFFRHFYFFKLELEHFLCRFFCVLQFFSFILFPALKHSQEAQNEERMFDFHLFFFFCFITETALLLPAELSKSRHENDTVDIRRNLRLRYRDTFKHNREHE